MSTDKNKKKNSVFSRRNFLKKSGMTVATFAASSTFLKSPVPGKAPATGKVLGANDRLVAGFIGMGEHAFNSHLRSGVKNQPDQNVVGAAVCDLWSKRMERGLQELELGAADGYTDYRKLLDRNDIDIVFIASVNHWHAKHAIDAMDAGKHIYLEKPMTRYLGEAFDVYDNAKRTGKVVQIGSQYCSEGKWRLAAEMIRSGRIGAPVLAQDSFMRNKPEGEWNTAIDPELTSDTINWNDWLGPVPSRPFSADHYFRWRKYYAYSSGIIGDVLAHRIFPLILATGNPEFPRRVAAMGTRKITPDRDVPDNIQLIAEFPSGLNVFVPGSTVNEQGVGQVFRGHEATLYFSGNRMELRPERPFADLIDHELHENIQPDVSIPDHIVNFFDAIREGIEPNCNIDVGIRGQTVLSLAEMSDRLGQMLYFDSETRTITTGSGKVIDPITHGTLESS